MNVGMILLIAVGAIWAIGLFLGAIGGLSKTFTHSPTSLDSSSIQAQQQQTIQDTEEKRQKLMDDMKQKMDDARQNN